MNDALSESIDRVLCGTTPPTRTDRVAGVIVICATVTSITLAEINDRTSPGYVG